MQDEDNDTIDIENNDNIIRTNNFKDNNKNIPNMEKFLELKLK